MQPYVQPGARPLALTLHHARHRFLARGEGRLPAFAGSTWRGAFGHALKRTVCVMRLRPCAGCPLERSCLYPTLFAAAPDPEGERLSRLERVAQPYVLMPPAAGPRQLRPGDAVELGLTLVGRAIGQRAYVARALARAGADGLGPDRLPLGLEASEAAPALPALPGGGRLRLELVTPLRLKRDGRLVTPEALTPADVLMALLRRVSMLRAFHDGAPLALDFKALKAEATAARWARRAVGWQETTRFSTRQGQRLRMGGLVGTLELVTAEVPRFHELLALAPWIGIGKGASMGLGQVRLGEAA
jgi:hypothetical protein